jgi:flavin reductase (DIM6/NTAB) family NADH-FMN oxidoreductase RutF
LFIWALIHPY